MARKQEGGEGQSTQETLQKRGRVKQGAHGETSGARRPAGASWRLSQTWRPPVPAPYILLPPGGEFLTSYAFSPSEKARPCAESLQAPCAVLTGAQAERGGVLCKCSGMRAGRHRGGSYGGGIHQGAGHGHRGYWLPLSSDQSGSLRVRSPRLAWLPAGVVE